MIRRRSRTGMRIMPARASAMRPPRCASWRGDGVEGKDHVRGNLPPTASDERSRPDGLVRCEHLNNRNFVNAPLVKVEVLSPSAMRPQWTRAGAADALDFFAARVCGAVERARRPIAGNGSPYREGFRYAHSAGTCRLVSGPTGAALTIQGALSFGWV